MIAERDPSLGRQFPGLGWMGLDPAARPGTRFTGICSRFKMSTPSRSKPLVLLERGARVEGQRHHGWCVRTRAMANQAAAGATRCGTPVGVQAAVRRSIGGAGVNRRLGVNRRRPELIAARRHLRGKHDR